MMIGAGSTYKREQAARARSALPAARVRGFAASGRPVIVGLLEQASLIGYSPAGLAVVVVVVAAAGGRVSRVEVHIGYNRAAKTLCQVGSFLKIASNLREERRIKTTEPPVSKGTSPGRTLCEPAPVSDAGCQFNLKCALFH